MSGNNIKEGLEGLSKIEEFSDVLFVAIYWIAVAFVILYVAYLILSLSCMISRRKKGISRKDSDDFLDD